MFCPNCGQEKLTPETNFCSRCGFLLSGTAELLRTGGVIPGTDELPVKRSSPRTRGVKQGIFIFLLTFLVAPIVGLISVALDVDPVGVGIAGVLLFFGGLLRVVYALMFEDAGPGRADDYLAAAQAHMFGGRQAPRDLPPANPQVFVSPQRDRRDTNDLEPRSVTEGTTKLLEQEERTQ